MSTRRTDAEYAAMADEFKAGNWQPVAPPTIGPGDAVKLKNGRPVGRKQPAGNTPTTSVRLPAEVKARLDARAADESVKPAEVIRRALVEYLDRPA